VTPLRDIAPLCDETLEAPLLRRHLHKIGVRMHCGLTVDSIEKGRITATNEFGEPAEFDADSVVLVTQRLSNDSLYLDLRQGNVGLDVHGIHALYRIGDCTAPRSAAEAIFDGHRLGREIDSKNPAVPLPYRRERSALPAL
jgi:dimethylamine/trimethylamine dehydrogenase